MSKTSLLARLFLLVVQLWRVAAVGRRRAAAAGGGAARRGATAAAQDLAGGSAEQGKARARRLGPRAGLPHIHKGPQLRPPIATKKRARPAKKKERLARACTFAPSFRAWFKFCASRRNLVSDSERSSVGGAIMPLFGVSEPN